MKVLGLLGIVVIGVNGIPMLKEYDIWGDDGNLVNGSEGIVMGREKYGKGNTLFYKSEVKR